MVKIGPVGCLYRLLVVIFMEFLDFILILESSLSPENYGYNYEECKYAINAALGFSIFLLMGIFTCSYFVF